METLNGIRLTIIAVKCLKLHTCDTKSSALFRNM